jgi:uncharacterized protein involved in exopolysaccharide biosynthesis
MEIDNQSVSISDLVQTIIKFWHKIAIFILVSFVVALGYIQVKQPVYTSTMTLVGSQQSGFENGGQSGVGAIMQLTGANMATSERLSQIQTLLTSNSVSSALYRDVKFRNLLNPPQKKLFSNHFSNVEDIRKTLKNIVSTNENIDGTIDVSVSFRSGHEAKIILLEIYNISDGILRRVASDTAQARIDYLNDRIENTQSPYTRDALINILAQQTLQLTLSRAKSPYAAIILDPPLEPEQPVNRSLLTIFSAILFGLIIGILYVLWNKNTSMSLK